MGADAVDLWTAVARDVNMDRATVKSLCLRMAYRGLDSFEDRWLRHILTTSIDKCFLIQSPDPDKE
jgi:hypothetical protein